MKKIRWGIIGAGRIAHQFSQDMVHVNNSVIAAVAARDEIRSQAFAQQYNVPNFYGNYDHLLNDKNVDAVYIATPHNLHFEQAKAAILAGKSVLCEKPITISPLEAETLFNLAKLNNVYLIEGMWTFFLPAIQKAKQWVKQGLIGDLVQIKADFGYPQIYSSQQREYNIDLAGGAIFEMGIYPIALAHLFMEQSPEHMSVSKRLAPNGVEDDVIMIFEYPNVTATLATSFRCKLQNWAYIIGTKGYIAIPDFWRASQCSLFVLDEEIECFKDHRSSLGFNYEIATVADEILAGKFTSEFVTPQASITFQKHIASVRSQCLL